MKKHIYRWHRITALIISVPVLLWAISGFMHPFMTNVKPALAQQWIPVKAINTEKIKWSLRDVLAKHTIAEFTKSRIVSMGNQYFYQIALPGDPELIYISASNGERLKGGDALYARHLAKQFLDGSKEKRDAEKQLASLSEKPIVLTVAESREDKNEDCCQLATYAVLSNQSGTPIKKVSMVTRFGDEYLDINRLLPVYKVETNRADGIRVYVDTQQDRLGYATDNRRKAFDQFFRLFHTLSWMNAFGNGKLWIEIGLMLLVMSSSLMGLYIFFTTKGKKGVGNPVSKWRWNHRYTSLAASFFTLAFSFSGAFHAWSKLTPDTRHDYKWEPVLKTEKIQGDLAAIQALFPSEQITQVSPIQMHNVYYWQVYTKKESATSNMPAYKSRGKGMEVKMPPVHYIHMDEQRELPKGEEQYAAMLAAFFSKMDVKSIASIQPITKFEGEYGFVNKRLPVWKVSFPQHHQERYYVETSTGKLSVRVDDTDLPEGYSFSLLHKHHFMDFGGKIARDLSTLFWSMMQIVMVGVGLTFYFKQRSRQKNPTYHA